MQDNETSATDVIINLKLILDTNVNKYLAENYPNVSLPEVSANVAADGLGSYIAVLKCPIADCEKTIKITRNKTRWNTSNFYSHVSTHSSKHKPEKQTTSIVKMFAKMSERSSSLETNETSNESFSNQTNETKEEQNVLKRKRIYICDSSSEDEIESTVANPSLEKKSRGNTIAIKKDNQNSKNTKDKQRNTENSNF